MVTHKDLDIWEMGIDLVKRVYHLTGSLSSEIQEIQDAFRLGEIGSTKPTRRTRSTQRTL